MSAKERILETASRLFYTQGYNSTGINQVIKEADIAKASLYQHFPSKDDLLIAYLKEAGEKSKLRNEIRIAKYETPVEKILALSMF